MFFFQDHSTFELRRKKIDGLKALRIFRTIYGHFFVKIDPIRENWINR